MRILVVHSKLYLIRGGGVDRMGHAVSAVCAEDRLSVFRPVLEAVFVFLVWSMSRAF
jgi:hypothetical protein